MRFRRKRKHVPIPGVALAYSKRRFAWRPVDINDETRVWLEFYSENYVFGVYHTGGGRGSNRCSDVKRVTDNQCDAPACMGFAGKPKWHLVSRTLLDPVPTAMARFRS